MYMHIRKPCTCVVMQSRMPPKTKTSLRVDLQEQLHNGQLRPHKDTLHMGAFVQRHKKMLPMFYWKAQCHQTPR